MREMKDSGSKWIGVIPDDWICCKQKYVLKLINGRAYKEDEFETNGTYKILRVGNLFSNPVWYTSSLELDEKKYCYQGDLLYSWSMSYAPFIWSGEKVIYHYHIWKVDFSDKITKKFAYYYLYSLTEALKAEIHETTMGFITMGIMNNSSIVFPSKKEQRLISAYLDTQYPKIDSLIANQQAQIEKLKAYKQSLITEVVTKGLDPDVPVKDSGVEWIGEIASNFTVQNIRSLFQIRKDIIGHEPETVLSITQNGIKIKDISENSGQMAGSYANYQIVHVGDFAMNHMDLLTGGIGISEYEGVTSPDYRVFVLRNTEMNARYFLYIFESYYRNKIFYAFGQGAANLGRWRLPAKNFYSTFIPVAPVEEQKKIVEYLDKKLAQIDKLISIKQQKIEKLTQYKKSLIYEYVTGKKEVK